MNKGQTAGLTAFFEAMSLPQTSLLGLLKAGCPGNWGANSRQMDKRGPGLVPGGKEMGSTEGWW